MKNIVWLLLPVLLLYQLTARAQSDAALDDFGSAFLTALVGKDIEALRPLMVTEADARMSMAHFDMTEEERNKELAIFNGAYPRMKSKFEACFEYAMAFLEKEDIEKIAYIKITRERPSQQPNIEKCDLLIYFNIGQKEYFIDVDDCVRTSNGWRLTSKFEVQEVESAVKNKAE